MEKRKNKKLWVGAILTLILLGIITVSAINLTNPNPTTEINSATTTCIQGGDVNQNETGFCTCGESCQKTCSNTCNCNTKTKSSCGCTK